MNFYTNVARFQNDILYRGVENGKRVFRREKFSPTLYQKNPKSTWNLHTMDGMRVSPLEFKTMGDASRHLKQNQTDDLPIHGTTNYISQFLYDKFPESEIEYNFDQICTAYVDIETTCEDGFPDVDSPQEQITVITSYDTSTKVYNVFTHKDVAGAKGNLNFDLSDPANRQEDLIKKLKINHKVFVDEKSMLMAFLTYWKSIYPDIVTGWNNQLFDIPYLVARMNLLFGEDVAQSLSPWNKVERREVEVFKKMKTKYVLTGISVLDYLELYKKFSQGSRASYKLDYIANLELGFGKVSYDEHGAMHLFYKNDFKRFVEYNIVDVVLIVELERRKRMIELAAFMAFWTRVNFDQIHSPVRMIESISFTHMMNKGIVFPPMHDRTKTRQNKGAYVKPPVVGKHDWVVSFDVTSLYPSIIMQQNISPETLVEDGYVAVTVEELLAKSIDLGAQRNSNETVCGNGWKFRIDKSALLPDIIERLFAARKMNKTKMLEADRALQDPNLTSSQKAALKETKEIYDIRQNAIKILLNSFYGAFANEHFIFFDMRLAEAVTYTGQVTIRWAIQAVNKYLNTLLKTNDVDYVIASDTDSLYIRLDELVKSVIPDEQDPQKIVQFLDNVCEKKIFPLIEKSYLDLAAYLNSRKPKIEMKREVIASRGIWTGKKHYALNVYNKEGTAYSTPELKLVGLETAKSSTPQFIRDALTESINITMNKEEADLTAYVNQVKKDYYSRPIEDISWPRGVTEITKYHSTDASQDVAKGCPVHVRGSIMYNNLITQHKLDSVYAKIKEGDKIKFAYLKKPNPLRQHVLGFVDKIPPQFELDEYIDKDLMFEKQFIEPLHAIVQHTGWSIKPKPQTLYELFV